MQNLLFQAEEISPTQYWVGLVLRFLLIVFFITMSVKNLMGDQQMTHDFARWGFPGWLRAFTAFAQIIGATLLIHPSSSFYGAAILTYILCGALLIHMLHDRPADLLSPIFFMILVGIVLLISRPVFLRS